MDFHRLGQEKTKGNRVNLSEDLEGTNVFWSQLTGFHPQGKISGREPHSLLWILNTISSEVLQFG